MAPTTPYVPSTVFVGEAGEHTSVPRVLLSPARYIQGPGVLEHLGRYLSLVPSERPALLASPGGRRRHGDKLAARLVEAGAHPVTATFGGECSDAEIERLAAALRAMDPAVDALVTLGGGKCIDAGKAVAHHLGVPVVVCPSVASTDAPCSALSVVYTPAGEVDRVVFFPHSPALVVVDTGVIAAAPVRFLLAGMGDALATWYEARVCVHNPDGRSILGGRITAAAAAIAELCARTIFDHGPAAARAARDGVVTEELERVVEANTLLSGVGFESGGLAGAHAVASALTALPAVHASALHGEMVAIGVLTQLILEGDLDEWERVATLFSELGLPIHLGGLGVDVDEDAEGLERAMTAAASYPIMRNEPVDVSPQKALQALRHAHHLGARMAAPAE